MRHSPPVAATLLRAAPLLFFALFAQASAPYFLQAMNPLDAVPSTLDTTTIYTTTSTARVRVTSTTTLHHTVYMTREAYVEIGEPLQHIIEPTTLPFPGDAVYEDLKP